MSAPVIVYSTAYCGFCVQAKRLLSQLGIPYDDVMLDNDPALRQKLSQENSGYRTVPMIFVEGKFIGGYNELSQLHRQGRLAHLLPSSAGASTNG